MQAGAALRTASSTGKVRPANRSLTLSSQARSTYPLGGERSSRRRMPISISISAIVETYWALMQCRKRHFVKRRIDEPMGEVRLSGRADALMRTVLPAFGEC